LTSARPSWRDLKGYSFEQFVSDFKLKYKVGSEEYAQRKSLFEKELNRVVLHNSGNASWKETVNPTSALTSEEKKAFYGRNKKSDASHRPKHESKLLPSHFTKRPLSELPTDVDWRTEGVVTAVKDQGHCGSCWAFASTAVIESHVALSTGQLFDLSPQQIAACSPNPNHCGGNGNCQGATAEVAFDYVAGSDGLMEEFQYSYSSYFGVESGCAVPEGTAPKAIVDGYVKLGENNYSDLLNAIAQVGPIAVSVDASTWHAYAGGIFDGCNQETPDINHAVVLVGYGTDNGKDYWLVRNSWSASWGEAGYIRLARSNTDESKCGTDVTPHDGSACDGQDDPITVCGTCGILYDNSYPTGAGLA